ncbi:MAG TPA: TadE family protein [Chloroflexia bacterium]|nr:TadE family protein [Chloroflexia bacterium]
MNKKKWLKKVFQKRIHQKTEGQAFLELTLIIPVIFVLVVGVIAIGIALSYKMKAEAVAREATRVVAKNTGNGSVQMGLGRSQLVAQQYGFDLNKLNIEIQGAEDFATPARGGRVTATITYHYKMFNFVEIQIVGKHTEAIECWRKRDDENSGGTCVSPDQQ